MPKALKLYLAVSLVAVVATLVACGGGSSTGDPTSSFQPPTSAQPTPADTPVGADQRASLSGTLTLDGKPLTAQFLGAVVIHNGLVNACQVTIPLVDAGSYQIDVMAAVESIGCGTPGSVIVLWTNVGNGTIYAKESLPWPGHGPTTFDGTFSTREPTRPSLTVTQFYGHVTGPDGALLPPGTVIAAFINGTRCGVATVKDYAGDVSFVISVSGPQVTGCALNGAITFRANGMTASPTAKNDLAQDRAHHEIELTLS